MVFNNTLLKLLLQVFYLFVQHFGVRDVRLDLCLLGGQLRLRDRDRDLGRGFAVLALHQPLLGAGQVLLERTHDLRNLKKDSEEDDGEK